MIKSGEYEFRTTSYVSLRVTTPAVHVLPASVIDELWRLFVYSAWLDCDTPEWQDTANRAWSTATGLYFDPEDLDTADEPGQGEA